MKLGGTDRWGGEQVIWAITYGDEKYQRAKKLNCKTAKRYGADKVIAYGPEDIEESFKNKNALIWNKLRGGGYWIWKPYIMLKTLKNLKKEDYLIYSDAGTIYVNKVSELIKCMEKEKEDIMVFSLSSKEREWTKRDAFILLGCDEPAFTDTAQILGGYVVLKKTEFVEKFLNEWLFWLQDARAVTDQPNCLGKDNYSEFIEHRHDQSIFSLLCKKYGVEPFRDPSQFGERKDKYAEEICQRSEYPQIVFSHRRGDMKSLFQLKYEKQRWYKFLTWEYYRKLMDKYRKHLNLFSRWT